MARPREFEPEEALDKAMHRFWAKGYFDTSIRDLVECTGVNYYGLYGAFESKHGLFLAALDHYRRTVTSLIVGKLNTPGPLQATIERALHCVLDLMQTPDGRVGCLMCNTALELAPHDTEAAAKVRDHMAHLRAALRARLSEGLAAGELPRNADLDALSEFLTTTIYSIGLLVRSGQDDAYVRRHIGNAMTAIG